MRMKKKSLGCVILVTMGLYLLGGCTTPPTIAEPRPVPPGPTPTDSGTPKPPPPGPDSDPGIVYHPPPKLPEAPEPTETAEEEETGLAIPNEKQPVDLDREVTAQAFAYYDLDDVQMVVIGEPTIDKYGLTDDATQQLREHFSEMGMRLQNVGGSTLGSTDAAAIAGLSTSYDADLVTVVSGTARERGKLGRMYSYEATVRVTVYEAGGQTVVTKELTKVGSRSSKPDRAAESALRAAAGEIGPYISEQLIRKVGQNVLTRRVVITKLKYYASVTQIIEYLKRQQGINDVRLISWEADVGRARFVVYLQPAAKDNLGIYVTQTPNLEVKVVHIDNARMTGEEQRRDR